jgi:hypothetical protein
LHLIDTVPWFLPGAAASLAISLAVCGPIGRVLGARARHLALLFGPGLVIAATLTPQREAVDLGATGTGTCDFGRITLASPAFYGGANDAGENVLMFVPIGVAVALMPRSRRTAALAAGALLLPFMIEAVQLQALALDRACESADVVDNLAGLAIGLAIGVALSGATWVTARSRGGQG